VRSKHVMLLVSADRACTNRGHWLYEPLSGFREISFGINATPHTTRILSGLRNQRSRRD